MSDNEKLLRAAMVKVKSVSYANDNGTRSSAWVAVREVPETA